MKFLSVIPLLVLLVSAAPAVTEIGAANAPNPSADAIKKEAPKQNVFQRLLRGSFGVTKAVTNKVLNTTENAVVNPRKTLSKVAGSTGRVIRRPYQNLKNGTRSGMTALKKTINEDGWAAAGGIATAAAAAVAGGHLMGLGVPPAAV